uniref:Uncharacterized protein n=1 Tax=Caenorhabditis tropicalis TaxID=1561998 RepID=A0A1I7TB00_9PELO
MSSFSKCIIYSGYYLIVNTEISSSFTNSNSSCSSIHFVLEVRTATRTDITLVIEIDNAGGRCAHLPNPQQGEKRLDSQMTQKCPWRDIALAFSRLASYDGGQPMRRNFGCRTVLLSQ